MEDRETAANLSILSQTPEHIPPFSDYEEDIDKQDKLTDMDTILEIPEIMNDQYIGKSILTFWLWRLNLHESCPIINCRSESILLFSIESYNYHYPGSSNINAIHIIHTKFNEFQSPFGSRLITIYTGK